MTARIAEDDKKEYANKECDGRNVMENLIFSLNATIPIFLVMVAGYVFRQMKIVDDGFVKTLNSFNYKITLPVILQRRISMQYGIRHLWFSVLE